jgi:organic radical activating enzyme
MESIRIDMMEGKPIQGCEICYELEYKGLRSYRQDKFSRLGGPIDLKVRLFGSACNLSCYMCYPFNSSGRRKESKQLPIDVDIFKDTETNIDLGTKPYKDAVEDILQNIDKVRSIKIIGGEPFLMPRHYDFIYSIPPEHRKRIQLKYDTNLTKTTYRNHSLDSIIEEFPNILLNVSCDHYGEQLGWIRYPIDVAAFEANLIKYKHIISKINVCASILNVRNLISISAYYEDNFGIPVVCDSAVNAAPYHLSPRQLDKATKDLLIKLYLPYGKKYEAAINILSYDALPNIDGSQYIKALDKIRGTNANEIFGMEIYR